jgi:CHAT domain-containing protein
MSSFYGNLRTKTKVESLRQAQLDMIRGKVTARLLAQRGLGGVGKLAQTGATRSLSQAAISTSHPYFWAPFVLIGDGK